jgi:hypothetical protein
MRAPAPVDIPWTEVEVPRPKPPMPMIGEWMTPWIGASFLVSVLTVTFVVGGQDLPVLERVLLAISVCATLTAAVLVGLRSSRAREASVREERARPAAEALDEPVPHLGTAAYVEGMQRWTTTMLELLEHAQGCVPQGSSLTADLDLAVDDTRELQRLLQASSEGDLDIHDAATIHAVCTLWETNQPRFEELAASADPGWHRRWRARSVADRRLRHGGMVSVPVAMPYRT